MKILVTGAAGLLGSRFVEWILKNKPEVEFVIGVDDLSGGYKENLPAPGNPRFKFYQQGVEDIAVDDIFSTYNPTHVVHLAAYAAEGLSPFIRRYNYTNNLLATANLINSSIKWGIRRFLFTSSLAVYGRGRPPFHEDDVPRPIDPYGVAKYACEMDLRIAGEQHGLDWCVLRPHNVYGRHQNIWDVYRNVLGIWMWQHLNGLPLVIYGDGEQKRAFSDIQDSLEPMWVALTEPQASKQIINLGGIKEYTINNAANALIEVMGGGTVQRVEERHEVKHAWTTWEKSIDILGFEHKTDIHDGLKEMWEWAKVQPHRPRKVWDIYELDKGMYNYWKQENLK